MSRHNIDINGLGEAMSYMPQSSSLPMATFWKIRESVLVAKEAQRAGDVSRWVELLRQCETQVYSMDGMCGDDVPLVVRRELRLLGESLVAEIIRVRCEEEQGYRDMSRIRQERRQAKKVANKKSRKKP